MEADLSSLIPRALLYLASWWVLLILVGISQKRALVTSYSRYSCFGVHIQWKQSKK
jgi:hypothetical protein